ncbi:hypothetical protein SAMN05216223_11979 [Actinacidiphila yanglinensis]|uniref:Copper(I)-binding protein n=1 Tax=Actinacidiphila yanglinensis TaxID=310779 RepID=A0A1H6DTA5_9ACTN|nr:DUF461 domain-containing protein [Actinacidiphila yanglinensis]SEG88511.1 hypothetical protein SAMN05216223_11979 [Actinacidiphila yanglinensis]
MVRSIRRGAVAAVLALSLAPLAAACSAGNDAATLGVHPDSDSGSTGNVKVQNAFVLTDPSGPATITARLFNNGSSAQSLQSVQIAGTTTAQLKGTDGGPTITVPAHSSVLLGGKGNPAAVLPGRNESLRDGDVQEAVFSFSAAGAVKMQVNVTPATRYFAPYGPGALPTTAAPTTPSTPASPSTSTNPGSTSTPTGKPSGTATPTSTATAGA